MTARQRQRLRRLQDKVASLAERLGYSGDTSVTVEVPHLTASDVRNFLYPQYQHIFEALLREWAFDLV
jgi:hypothetical protein